jgi:hypothetical protein
MAAVFHLSSFALQRYHLTRLEGLRAYCVEKGMDASLSIDGSNVEFRCVRPN